MPGSRKAANMLKAKTPRKRKTKKRGSARTPVSFRGVAIFLLLLVVGLIGVTGYIQSTSKDTIIDGVRIATIDVSGLTPDEARDAIADVVANFSVTYADEHTEYDIALSTPPDAGAPLVTFDIDGAVQKAFAVGHTTDPFTALYQRGKTSLFDTNIPLGHVLDEPAFTDKLTERFGRMLENARDARLIVTIDESDEVSVTVEDEASGAALNLKTLISDTRTRITRLSPSPIMVLVRQEFPSVTRADVEPLIDDVPSILARAPLDVVAKEKEWTISKEKIATWISAVTERDGTRLTLDADAVEEYLVSRGDIINKEPVDAIFRVEDDRVVEFQPSIDGEMLDIPTSYDRIVTALLNEQGLTEEEEGPIELPILAVHPRITTAKSNRWGISDILGVGESNFRGSPSNRRVNIRVGADLLDGILIPPGEELALIELLKPFNGENGYLQELVIKEGETKPEYGGGLCQIGTTTFRAVLNAGLPVISRRNHSYRVPYYERDGDGNYMGPGKDATIYDPAPDFRFLNDTDNTVLFETEIIGYNKLRFTLWGKDDGRVAEESEVEVWNVRPPPEKKIIKTTELTPGEEKCTESPHSGASTNFTYTVTYPDGEVKEEDFTSHYKPWGEVCLLGVTEEELAADETDLGEVTDLPTADASGVSGE
ncbi:VanW family protein [Patescibacteria group bacterium]